MAKSKATGAAQPLANGSTAAKVPKVNKQAQPKVVQAMAEADDNVQESGEEEDDDTTTDEEGDDDDDEEYADVSKKGLARLMSALGEDGLSDLDKAHLGMVTGANGEEDEEENEVSIEDDNGLDGEEDDEEDVDEENQIDAETIPASAPAKGSDSLAASIARSGLVADLQDGQDDDEEEEDEEEEDPEAGDGILLESLSDAAISALPESVRSSRTNREKINNVDGLRRICADIALGGSGSSSKGKGTSLPWIETLVVPYDKSIQELVGSEAGAADDDLKRELEFYKQALHSATQGRVLAEQANLPFTRPSDYFAEMVKSDDHMERVRQRLLDERAGLKASEEARKQRELKKFGKKVQVEKQLERQRNKREFEDKVKGFKRKRQGPDGGADGDDGDDDFDVRLESAMANDRRESGRAAQSGGRGGRSGAGGKMPRSARDAKYGFGGKKRHSKENTRESTNDFGSGSSSRGRGGGRGASRGGRGGRGGGGRGSAKRPGKARRAAGRS